MARHYLVGIVGQLNEPAPAESVDYLMSFDPPTIAIKYCGFCGQQVNGNMPVLVTTRIG